MQKNVFEKKGFAILISVLVASAVSLAVAVSLLLLGSDALRINSSVAESTESKSIVNACVEDALEKIRESFLIGSGGLSFGDGSCTYVVSSASVQQRTIIASSIVSSAVRKVRVSVDILNPKINITSWQEVSD